MSFGNTDDYCFKFCLGTLKTITFVYDVITLPIYAIFQNPIKVKKLAKQTRAVPINNDETSVTYRSTTKISKYHTEFIQENIDSIPKMMIYCSAKYGDRNCLGTREILSEDDEVQPDGKVHKKYEMGDYKWKSQTVVNRLAQNFGKGLVEIGIKPKTNVVLYAETREEWLIASHGLFKQNFILVTLYATLGDEGVIHAVTETDAETIITSEDLLPKLAKLLTLMPKVKNIVYIENQIKSSEAPKISGDVKIWTYKKILELGAQSSNKTENLPNPSDTAVIMYTSGSTGTPKGVILVHQNLIATLKGFCDSTPLYNHDTLIGFLPLAHVFELLVENVCIFTGVRIGYSGALTLLDTSSKIKTGCKGDATVLRPTVMTSVPLVLGRISQGIREKVSKGKFLTRLLFNFAYQYKIRWMKLGFLTPLLDRIIFAPVKRLVGGNVRLIIAGGSPLTGEVQEMVKTCFCTTLVQGYGLTESTACATVQDSYDITYNRVGAPMTGLDIKLINCEEGNYTVKDKPHPRGEIVLGGGSISEGYYKLPDKTEEDFFNADGRRWFKTGDIGEIQQDGVLKIIDRKKDLVKLQMGEYIALGKIECQLKMFQLVDNICVYGDSTQNFCVALVVPHQENLVQLAEKIGITNKTFEELCDHAEVVQAFARELAAYGKSVKLQKYEIPTKVTLMKEVWSPENGILTTTFKLKRKHIEEQYKNEIRNMYK